MNPRDISLILAQGLMLYLLFATIIIDASIVGTFGNDMGKLSRTVFGLLAYPMYAVVIYILYKIYKTHEVSFRKAEVVVSSFLLFFTLLIAQALLLPVGLDGSFGRHFVAFLTPFIGLFGIWVLWGMLTTIAITMLKDITVADIVAFVHEKRLGLQKKQFKKSSQEQPEPEDLSCEPTDEFDSEDQVPEKDLTEEVEVKFETPMEQTLSEKMLNILPEDETSDFEIKRRSAEDSSEVVISDDDAIVLSTPTDYAQTIIDEASDTKSVSDNKVDQDVFEKIDDVPPEQPTHNIAVLDELEENKKLLNDIEVGEVLKPKDFQLPPISILHIPQKKQKLDENYLDQKISNLIDKLNKFKIEGDVVCTYTGPVVSTFEFKPAAHIKVSKILTLQDDLSMALKARTIRIQAPIPGKDVVGIEIPNDEVETIYLREILESDIFQKSSSPLTIALGQDIVGKPFVTDLKKLPHLLIAGTTGSGKSVGINAMILSLLYRNSPDQLKFIMIDPKMLEFSIYNDIPHLLTPVITQPKQAITALNNMVVEMERRYTLMSESRTKNIDNYNEKVKKKGKEPLPFIVVVIDELADLMMTSGKEVEVSIGRLAQMARASGIHLIVATQRPSVDVVTGLIKANLPSRISYRVGQKIDSKVILDSMGAESLLGRGDMLFTPPGSVGLVRLHAPWADEGEIEEIVDFIKSQRGPDYDQKFLASSAGDENADIVVSGDLDPLFEEAKAIVYSDQKTSISYLQRKLQIGYNKAARIVEQLEAMGVLSEPNAKGVREIL